VVSIGVDVFLGLDVGKRTHHEHGLAPVAKTVFDKPLPNSEPKLRAVLDKLMAKFVTVRLHWCPAADHRPGRGLSDRLPALTGDAAEADLFPGEAETDAAVIADTARTLRTLDLADEVTAELTMLVGFDQDLTGEANRTSNRIRGLLTQFHPSLERALGPSLDGQAVTWLLESHGSPQALRKAAAAGWSRSSAQGPRAWPNGWSTTSSPRSTSKPSASPAPVPVPST
jgi:hypothetical protein